jgi:hypothetical protein
MDVAPECVQIVRIRAHSATESELREIRPRFVGDVSRRCPGLITTILARVGDDTYLDVWVWRSAADAQAARDSGREIDGFVEWNDRVEILSFDQLEVVGRAPAGT